VRTIAGWAAGAGQLTEAHKCIWYVLRLSGTSVHEMLISLCLFSNTLCTLLVITT
jgi:Na+-driven multidrug efflux pump